MLNCVILLSFDWFKMSRNKTIYESKDLYNLVPFALGWQTTVYFAAEIILSFIGIIANITVLFVLLKPGFKNQSSYNILIMILVALDVAFHLTLLWGISTNMLNGGYALGRIGCIVQSILHEFFGSASIFLCLAISFERYCAIVKKALLNKIDLSKVLALISVPVLLLCLFPTLANSTDVSYALSVSRVVCYGNWSSYNTENIIHTTLGLVIIMVGVILAILYYVFIYLHILVRFR